ncbi:glycine cleavage system protein H [Candidatus Bathyarchaeota archaeon]|nr:glycine cleavage system protein H [Candidatus Bathyarchaeota archaeon]
MVKVDEFNLPEELYYLEEGRSWAKIEPDGRVRVGLSDIAVKMAAEIIYIRLKPRGASVEQGKGFGTMESAKWVGPLKSPVSGTIVDVNDTLTKTPSIIVRDPYGEGWAVLIQPAKLESDLKNLLHTAEQLTEWALKEKSNLQKK